MAPLIAPPPSKVKLLLFGGLVLGLSAVVSFVAMRRLGAPLGWVVCGICLAVACTFTWTVYRAARTIITSEGIAQPSLQGGVSVRWVEIGSVLSERETLRIASPQGRLVIGTGWYVEPQKVKGIVLAKCQQMGIAVELKDSAPDSGYPPG
jgi:hypothetical protein